MLPRLHERFAAARAGDGAELEQALIRLVNLAVAYLYLFAAFLAGKIPAHGGLVLLVIGPVYFLVALGVLSWALARPGPNHRRRRVGAVADMGTTTLVMCFTEEVGTMLYPFILWAIIGNGFRYGRSFLRFAQILAIAGFLAVLVLNPYWHEHLILATAFLLGLVAIPFYVAMLVSRLNAARSEAEAANMAKTKFLAAASHDLRQPMQALSMYASVLEERSADANVRRVVNGVQLSVKTLERLFDSLLDISKIESGVIKPSVLGFELMPLIEQVVEAERPIAEQKGLALRMARTSANVRSDPALLERMLKNLLTNAIRYTERGRIVVGCRRLAGGRLRIEIVDSGVGIPTEEQDRIFTEYYQLEGASAQGLGLGLPIVKSLGDLLGHRVAVKSVRGRGSVFSVELEQAGVAAAAAVPAAPEPIMAGALVLLVDDDVEIRASMHLLLEAWGCRLVSGASLADVEEKLRAAGSRPDALIVDYRLADAMTGLQVIERMRAVYGAGLPALVITGTTNLPLLLDRALGIPIVSKPVPPGKLRAFLSRVRRREPKLQDAVEPEQR
jgi:signal transduction histidine kinase/CheY-like chemotaxis protein